MALEQVLSGLILFSVLLHQPEVDVAARQEALREMSAVMAALAAAVIMAGQVVQRLARHRAMLVALAQQDRVFMGAAAAVAQVLLEQTALVLLAVMAVMAWRPQ